MALQLPPQRERERERDGGMELCGAGEVKLPAGIRYLNPILRSSRFQPR